VDRARHLCSAMLGDMLAAHASGAGREPRERDRRQPGRPPQRSEFGRV